MKKSIASEIERGFDRVLSEVSEIGNNLLEAEPKREMMDFVRIRGMIIKKDLIEYMKLHKPIKGSFLYRLFIGETKGFIEIKINSSYYSFGEIFSEIVDSEYKELLSECIAETLSHWDDSYCEEELEKIIAMKMLIKMSANWNEEDDRFISDVAHDNFTTGNIEEIRYACGHIRCRFDLWDLEIGGEKTTALFYNKHSEYKIEYGGEKKEDFDKMINHWVYLESFINGKKDYTK